MTSTPWQVFERVANAQAIADSLEVVPASWSLTLLQDKAPKRDGWEREPFIPHDTIAELILHGEERISRKTGRAYRAYYSGFGLRTGEASGGLIAIDIDGPSAIPLLELMSGGDLPLTPSWTSGKPGRRQVLFQVPESTRALLTAFNRAVVTEFDELKTAPGELLEFRYNNVQSCLPASRHPETGAYFWINSPSETAVAIAPPWLCELLVKLASQERQASEERLRLREEKQRQREERHQQRLANGLAGASSSGHTLSLEDVLDKSLSRLSAEDIFNWNGHDFSSRGGKLVGYCPRHQSTSGTAFQLNPDINEWYCHGCCAGGGPVQYRHFINGGNGNPKGDDFVNIVAQLANEANVQMPPRARNLGEPDPTAYAEYVAREAEQARLEGIATEFDAERRKREWLRNLEHNLNPHLDAFVWGQSRLEAPEPQSLWKLGYEPSKTVHDRYLSLEGIDASFLCVVSAMNTGKTQALAQMVSDANESVLIVTNTVALAEALAVRYNCRCYNEDDINLGEINRLVITADSLWRVPTLNKRFKYMLIDEADQVSCHLVHGFTCKRNRERILAVFNYFACTSERYILADADLSGPVIDWHVHLREEKPFILRNTYLPSQDRLMHQFSSQVAAFEYGCNQLEEGKRILFCCDSKTSVKKSGALLSGIDTIEGIENLTDVLEEKLKTRFPDKRGRVIHGDNSGRLDVRNFIKNINPSLRFTPLDYLIYNSSMQSGVSIDVEAFDEVICLFTGYTLAHTELGQLAHRYRPNVPISFWVNPKGRTGLETNCYRIAADTIYKNQASGLSLRIDPDTGMLGINNPEFLQLFASLEARRNWSLTNVETAFKEHLQGMGYEIVPHPDEELLTGVNQVKEELKERKRIVDAAENATICKSPSLTSQQYESLKNKPHPDFYERCTLQKFELFDFYGLEVTPELIEKDDGGHLRRQLTRLNLLLNPESMARRMDLSDRRKHHAITDLKHYKLQRDLFSDLGLFEFIDPEREYRSQDLIALGERARLKAIDIKKILDITISVAPRYLRDGRIMARKGIKQALTSINTFGDRWLLSALAAGTATYFSQKEFATQEQADEYCSALSPMAKLICEAIAIEKRFKDRESTDSQVHAELCRAVGLKRKQTRQTRAGRFYQITSESWEFASAVLAHRQQQRDQRTVDMELELQTQATRFADFTTAEIQHQVEVEIRNNHQADAPDLVFLAESWIKFVFAPPKPLTSSHPPRLYSIYDFMRGGVTKSQKVTPGEKVQLNPLTQVGIAANPLTQLLIDELTVEQIATGRDDVNEFHDYLKVSPSAGGSFWLPAEWLESLKGFPLRRNLDAYTPRTPGTTLRTWRNWLLGVRSLAELQKFERKRTPQDLQAVVRGFAPEQLTAMQKRFNDLGIERDWLPPADTIKRSVLAEDLGLEITYENPRNSSLTIVAAVDEPVVAAKVSDAPTAAAEPEPNTNGCSEERDRWLPVEVCIWGRWITGFRRHVTTGQWLSPHGEAPLITPKEWRFADQQATQATTNLA